MTKSVVVPVQIVPLWYFGNEDYAGIACEGCAREWASKYKLTFTYPSYTDEKDALGHYAHADHFGESEFDYPPSCDGCGAYLQSSLTSDGEQYLRDNKFPEYVHDYYGVEYAG